MAKTKFDEFIKKEVKEQKGISIPVKASLLERILVKKVDCKKLHPNAADEFTFDTVGPSYTIISNYEEMFRRNMAVNQPIFDDALIVEKLKPSGYLILNGHHRWAAAMRVGIKKIPVKIVNLATETDIKKILENSKHNKRAVFDLDEVIFKEDNFEYLEPPLSFPYNIKCKKRIRLGIPALFYYLSKNDYDIWLYSANYYSIDDIKHFFNRYHVTADAIICGTHPKNPSESAINTEKLITNKYKKTVHIMNKLLTITYNHAADFKYFELDDNKKSWSSDIMDLIEDEDRKKQK